MLLNVRTMFLVSFFAALASQAFAQKSDTSEYGPFPAEEAAQKFVLHPDCKIELVAAEPDVIDPVHIAFNTDGKMWVVEYTDYPNGPGDGQPGLSRIRVLSDDDEDGRYNNPVTFAEKLLFANGLMFWKDGVIVTTDGKIQFMRDTDGDGKSDDTQIWFQGFATENPQLRHNHPQLAMDCKIYVANGLRGGNIVPGPDNPWGLDPKAKPLSISGRDFRFDPLTGKYEAIAGMGQFGMAFDQYGNRFVCTNRNPCRQIVLEDEQLELTPGLRIPRFYEDVAAAGEDSKLYPLSRTWTTSNLHANQFTAACGVLVYNDPSLGPEFFGNIFTCDPTANLVHGEIQHSKGAVNYSVPMGDGVEFLATKDEWFRPVNLSHGPDGSLYVVDMYRAVIEHPQFMPTELKDRPDLTLGTDRGRIWRVVSKSLTAPRQNEFAMNRSTVDHLIDSLKSRRYWKRRHSQRILLEGDPTKITQKIRHQFDKEQVMFAENMLYLLAAFDDLTVDDLATFSKRTYLPIVYPSILRIGRERFATDSKWHDFVNQTFVSRQENFPLNRHVFPLLESFPWKNMNRETRVAVLHQLLSKSFQNSDPGVEHYDEYWTSVFLGLSARQESLDLFKELVESIHHNENGSRFDDYTISVVHDLAQLVARQNQPGQISKLIDIVFGEKQYSPLIRLSTLAGIVDGTPGGRSGFWKVANESPKPTNSRIQKTIGNASKMLGEMDTSDKVIPTLLTVLSIADDNETLQQLVKETGSGDATRASLALSALLKRPADQVNPALIELLPKRRGAVRRSILQAMASNVSRAPALLDEIEAGRVPALEIDSTMEKAFYRLSDKEVVARAKKLLKREPPADRVKVLADYQQVLKMKSDPLRGKVVFEKNCATCHKVGGVGVNVAPDISDSRTKTPDFYLMNILDPNRAIDANYFSFNILDTDGKVHSGIVASETSTSITLKQPEGKMVTIDRENIEQFKNTGVSLMPVGLEQKINKQQMADVISFIKNWRYLDGQIPKEVIK